MLESSDIQCNGTKDLVLELAWLEKLLYNRISTDKRMTGVFNSGKLDIYTIAPPDFTNSHSKFASFIKSSQLSFEERVLFILAIAPHLKPEFLEIYLYPAEGLQLYKLQEFIIPTLGTRGQNYKGLLPTGLTYLYILAGRDVKERIRLQNLLSGMNKPEFQKAVLIQPHNLGEPVFSGRIVLVEEYLEMFTVNKIDKKTSIKYAFNNEK